MSDIVRLERLAPMRVAVVSVQDTDPEDKALHEMMAWAEQRGLPQGFRVFGCDNCRPDPDHIYTVWLTVGPDVNPGDGVSIEDVPGGLYAVTGVAGISNIGAGYARLQAWREDGEYASSEDRPCLEEHLSAPGTPPETYRLDLYMPLAE